jgi:hypothetical protein
MLLDQPRAELTSTDHVPNLLPPHGLTVPLWRSLLTNFRDRFFPERLPPLQLSSRPVNVGMLVGDVIDLPWYRTIFTSVGDVISPEVLPPLLLESLPVEVELVSDEPAWWRSLLRSLADLAAPERQAVLHLTSPPITPDMASNVLMVPRWSALIDAPKVFLPDPPSALAVPILVAMPADAEFIDLLPPEPPPDNDLERQLVGHNRRLLRRARLREVLWISLAVAEVTVLVVLKFVER